MLTLNGQVTNLFEAPSGVSKKTGEAYGGQAKVQILCRNLLQNGQERFDLVTLTVDDLAPYRALQGQMVRIPVGAFVNGAALVFYVIKTEAPERMPGPAAAAAGVG